MFLVLVESAIQFFGFPRARGDVPHAPAKTPSELCVFPAHAGMFPLWAMMYTILMCFPRARGDVPNIERYYYKQHGVFPAHAGMFLTLEALAPSPNSFPRARGDVPACDLCDHLGMMFSPRTRGCSSRPAWVAAFVRVFPRTRGCSALAGPDPVDPIVFPAHAGMFRHISHQSRHGLGFPRARGDVPACQFGKIIISLFSPRTRGCSSGWVHAVN